MGLLKLLVKLGNGSSVHVILPDRIAYDELVYISDNCPALKFLSFPGSNIPKQTIDSIPSLVCKWKNLEHLHLEYISHGLPLPKIIEEIGRHCKNFTGISVNGGPIGDEMVSVIVTWLPKLRTLDLSGIFEVLNIGVYLPKKNLLKILEGCKELDVLAVRECSQLKIDDEVLKQASYIKNFKYEVLDDFSDFYSDDYYDFGLDYYGYDGYYDYDDFTNYLEDDWDDWVTYLPEDM
ncbi:PREDICTED: putative F-box/LRR-repeat protein 23 isoform X2 [Nelumbo nucifera]|nr:PREDICTED: putative F-box/LRR-repeat protein 23 isoform X2 [Nelumbo nucifera]